MTMLDVPPGKVTVPRGNPPSLKVTVPNAPVLTVAVKTTELPYADGFGDDEIVV